ncbi:PIN domain-containing protein [Actinotalea fermentans]|uniref:PIN domain-containing protein n=1 Tax=Actinotalea fermentans TaxID=43671 RepID=A0A511YYZ9_9CELL|nr:hypothetical protein [Actinotalea fermentans]KGM15624.1 hypothetical protein N867_06950 [Actinotalea fermentans ATCC 43279 = JCM 9966 = DSM 3133]GEN80425.1 hypothetical protein AFE02nite_21590 [Actinotalea fermentans]
MLIYADGSALSRSVVGGPGGPDDPQLAAEVAAWRSWFAEHAGDVVTSPLGLTELRRAADPWGRAARDRARDLADTLTVVRFYDTALGKASQAQSVLPPFAAIHWGIATTHADVGAIATYDAQLAQVAVLHGVEVVTPGRSAGWWAG